MHRLSDSSEEGNLSVTRPTVDEGCLLSQLARLHHNAEMSDWVRGRTEGQSCTTAAETMAPFRVGAVCRATAAFIVHSRHSPTPCSYHHNTTCTFDHAFHARFDTAIR
jgi:hypothetical protein